MPADDDDEDWEYEYDREVSDDESAPYTPRRRRTRGNARPDRQIISATRQSDKFEVKIGDCVVVTTEGVATSDLPSIGLVAGMFVPDDKDVLLAKINWLNSHDDLYLSRHSKAKAEEDHNPLERFATVNVDNVGISTIECHAQLLSVDTFYQTQKDKPPPPKKKRVARSKAIHDHIYYCQQAVDTAYNRFSKRFNLEAYYHGRGTDMAHFLQKISEQIPNRRPDPVTPKRRKVLYNNADGDDDDGDKYNQHDDESDDDDDDDGDESESELRVQRMKRKRNNTPSPHKVKQLATPTLPRVKATPTKSSSYKTTQRSLHVAAVPESLPCRENEFNEIFLALEGAIHAGKGNCIYVSGIPGTGKTATVREVVNGLMQQVDQGELPPFEFVEINGMKVISPQDSYEILWHKLSGRRVAPASALRFLEREFNTPSPRRRPIVVLMDELDQLVTRNQAVMYNFFNWPALEHSRLIVVAVANTMDLPERTLSNKISSRLGLTRISFTTYSASQLETIIQSRIEGTDSSIIQPASIKYASQVLSRVGDARRALDVFRRAVEMAEERQERVTIKLIQEAVAELTHSPMAQYIMGLSTAAKVFLCALLARLRRGGLGSAPMSDILRETQLLTSISAEGGGGSTAKSQKLSSDHLKHVLFGAWDISTHRFNGFLYVVNELVEAGVIAHQSTRGEACGQVQLAIGSEEVRTALKDDTDVRGML